MKNEIGKYMKQTRLKLKIKQQDMAKLLGKQPADVCKYESGLNMPPAKSLLAVQRLAALHGLRVLP